MLLLDVNVLLYAFREELPQYTAYREWIEDRTASDDILGLANIVLSAFLRLVTNRHIFDPPTTIEIALQFVEALRAQPNSVIVEPGPRHWTIFTTLCRETPASGNLVPDAYLAALAIELDSEFITADRDYARFAGLRWRHPF
jgi:hypothetical protein